jgi:amino acid adenylation domain-containing protein/non-ribosomal peptide synthase protein (TIGR01720 family)
MKEVIEFIESLAERGVELWAEGDRLRYRSPKIELTPEILGRLKREKSTILEYFKKSSEHPLSYGQKALWYVYQLERQSPAYNIVHAAYLTADLDVDRLQKAWEILGQRHSVLRTIYDERDGQPIARIDHERPFPFQTIDASNWDEKKIDRWIQQEADRPFELEQEFSIRIHLLICSKPIFVLTVHHIAVDFWALEILLNELDQIYHSLKVGMTLSLPPLDWQYSDYVRWESWHLAGEEGGKYLDYWKQKLAGELPILDLPTDRPRPLVQTYRGKSYSFSLDTALSDRTRDLAKKLRLTPYVFFLTIFQILLCRYTHQEDIVIGSPLVGRSSPESEKIVGYFVNPVVLRVNGAGEPSFIEYSDRVRRVVLEALEHESYPFPLLVERLQPVRDPSRSPLFQVAFIWDKFRASEKTEGESPMSRTILSEQRGAEFDLSLLLFDNGGAFTGHWKYNTDLWDEESIVRMAGHFQTLLEGILREPDEKISLLPLLTERERHQILVEWNDTAVDYPLDKCLHHLVEEQVEQTPNAVAIVFESESLTYRELNARANQLARYLQKRGVGVETPVGICLERSLEMVVGLLAILKAGAAYVPLDPDYPPERLSFLLADAGVPLLVTSEKLLERLPAVGGEILCLDREREIIDREEDALLNTGVGPDNLAYIIYTSGSTGQPKGAMNTHRGIVNRLLWMQETYNLTPEDRVLQKTPFSFDVSVWEFFWPLLAGATLVVAKPGGHRDSTYLAETIAEQGITTLHFVPSMLQVFLEEERLERCQGLKRVICSGEALPRSLQDRFFERLNCELHNLYGPTEAAVDVTYHACQRNDPRASVPIGCPVANTHLYILDRQGQPVPVGVSGELHIGGVQVARGYLNRPELTAAKFIPDPFSDDPKARLYKTGDLARYLPDGNIEYIGRTDHQVKLRGFRIELGEIETVLNTYGGVREAVALVQETIKGNPQLIAYLVTTFPRPTSEELRDFLKQSLPEYTIPAFFVFLDSFPLTVNGKLDRKALPAPDEDLRSSGDFEAPRNLIEEALTKIWSEVLKVDKVGVRNNFFALGGDSILSMQIVSRSRQQGLRLTPKDVLQCQTIAELALVAELSGVESVDRQRVTGKVPLTPIAHWFFDRYSSRPHHFNQSVLLEVEPNLDLNCLQKAIDYLINHHDALRSRFTRSEEGWRWTIEETAPACIVERVDLSNLDPEGQLPAIEASAARIQLSLNLETGSLIRVVWFDYGPKSSGRLLLVIHYLVIDGVSWRILLEDLANLYRQAIENQSLKLPAKTTSVKAWSEQLQDYSNSETLKTKEKENWATQLDTSIASIPVDFPDNYKRDNMDLIDRVILSISEEDTRLIFQELSSVYNTRIDEFLLVPLVRTIGRWTGNKSVLIDLEKDGREEGVLSVDISRTIGRFTLNFPILLASSESGSIEEDIKNTKEQIRRVTNSGVGYGLLRYCIEDRAIRNRLGELPTAEVSFNYSGSFDESITVAPFIRFTKEKKGSNCDPFIHRSHLLQIESYIMDNQLQIEWTYSQNIHRSSSIESLAREYLESLNLLIKHCRSSQGVYTPSDFPNAELTQDEINQLITLLD